MSRMMQLSFLVIFMALVGCSSVTQGTQYSHEYTYTAKGSRSEAQHGHLYIDNEELPWVFEKVVFQDKAFEFVTRSNAWGTDGYHPLTSQIIVKNSTQTCSTMQLEKGYYLNNKRLTGTPADWFYVEWTGRKSAFVSPEKVNELIHEQKIKIKSGSSQLLLRKPLQQ